MGTYKIYRLFIFSPPDENFKEIKPTCGDDFVNLRIEGHDFINMIYDDNTPKSCSIPLKFLNERFRYANVRNNFKEIFNRKIIKVVEVWRKIKLYSS